MRVLLLGPQRSTFVKTDVIGLSHQHSVTAVDTMFGKGWKGALRMLRFTLRVIGMLPKHDVLYCWFADYHTLIPVIIGRMLGRCVVVVAGGYDVGYAPAIGYGARTRPLRWFCTRMTFRWATLILAVSAYAKRQVETQTRGLHAPVRVVYNGVHGDYLPNDVNTRRERIALTVCQGDVATEYLVKGLPTFINVARHVPDVRFIIVGVSGASLAMAQRDAADVPNVEIVPGFVSLQDVLIPLYLRTSAYCQFSVEETFGMVVVESMLCGCVPVTTNGGALPEVTGSVGLRADSVEGLAECVRHAMQRDTHDISAIVDQARQFTDVRRRDAVLAALSAYCSDPPQPSDTSR